MIVKTTKKSNFDLEDNIISNLIQKYGIEKQVGQTIEEMAELIVELNKNINRNKNNKDAILEEFVDVTFMLKQLKTIYNFSDEEIKEKMEEKMIKASKNL